LGPDDPAVKQLRGACAAMYNVCVVADESRVMHENGLTSPENKEIRAGRLEQATDSFSASRQAFLAAAAKAAGVRVPPDPSDT